MIPSPTRTVSYVATGVQTAFAVPFTFQLASDLVVSGSLSGARVLGVDYTVVLPASDGAGGTVNFLVAPAMNDNISIVRSVPFTQLSQLRGQGVFSPATLENMVDHCVYLCQQLNDAYTALAAQVGGVPGVFPKIMFDYGSSGSPGIRGVLRMYDATLAKFVYLYADNGALKVDDAEPT